MPASQAFVLMNLDLVAVPLQVGGAGVVTIYCGEDRARQLLGGHESVERRCGADKRSGYSAAYISSYVRVTPS